MSTLRRSIPLALLAAVALAFLFWPLALNAQPADGGVNVTATVQLDAPPAPPAVDAGSGSAVVVQVNPETGSATSSDGAVDTLPEVKAAFDELRADYAALKDASPGTKTVLFATLLALIFKLALDGVNYLAKYRWKKALGWIALGLAIPIAVLTKYVADKSWLEAIIVAGSGPGAIVVNELLKILRGGTSAPPATT